MDEPEPKRRKFSFRHFSLRALLALVTVLACAFGFVGNRIMKIHAEWRAEQEVLKRLRESPGVLAYEVYLVPRGAEWLQAICYDEEIFYRVGYIAIEARVDPDVEWPSVLPLLRNLESLAITPYSSFLARSRRERLEEQGPFQRGKHAARQQREAEMGREIGRMRARAAHIHRDLQRALPSVRVQHDDDPPPRLDNEPWPTSVRWTERRLDHDTFCLFIRPDE